MQDKNFFESEEQYKEVFFTQFMNKENAVFAWETIDKPTHYPCVVVKSCGKYIYVYPQDFPLGNGQVY